MDILRILRMQTLHVLSLQIVLKAYKMSQRKEYCSKLKKKIGEPG